MGDTFKVGDRVAVVRETLNLRRGTVGTVERVANSGRLYRLRLDSGELRRARAEWLVFVERRAPDPGTLTRTPDYSLDERQAQPKDVPLRDRNYLAWIRQQPCFFCHVEGRTQASHHGAGGMGTKGGDDTTIPACDACHGRHHGRDYSPHPMFDALTPAGRRGVLRAIAADFRAQYEGEVAG